MLTSVLSFYISVSRKVESVHRIRALAKGYFILPIYSTVVIKKGLKESPPQLLNLCKRWYNEVVPPFSTPKAWDLGTKCHLQLQHANIRSSFTFYLFGKHASEPIKRRVHKLLNFLIKHSENMQVWSLWSFPPPECSKVGKRIWPKR